MLIKNFRELAKSPKRRKVLEIIEAGLESIQVKNILNKSFSLKSNFLKFKNKEFNLNNFERVFVIGFGKGSSEIVKIISRALDKKITKGFDIDVTKNNLATIGFTVGTHPLPSQINLSFTEKVLKETDKLTIKDLVLVVVCGGGSVLFEATKSVNLQTLNKLNNALLRSGATISEINTVRKHLSRVKGGGLAKHLYPATVISLIFSDVPGNDLSVIASGPTTKNKSSINAAKQILQKYKISKLFSLKQNDFIETPTDEKYFRNVHNILMTSNLDCLNAMKNKAEKLGLRARIYSDRFQYDARKAGKKLIEITRQGEILLVGGETTLQVHGHGKGGRNQTLVLESLPHIKNNTIIASFDSDGWDFYGFAGGIGDKLTIEKIKKLNLDRESFLKDDNSYELFKKVGDGIDTGKLSSNVSDFIIVAKI